MFPKRAALGAHWSTPDPDNPLIPPPSSARLTPTAKLMNPSSRQGGMVGDDARVEASFQATGSHDRRRTDRSRRRVYERAGLWRAKAGRTMRGEVPHVIFMSNFPPILPSCYRGARPVDAVGSGDRAGVVVTVVVSVRALVVVVFAVAIRVGENRRRPTTSAMTIAAHRSALLLVLGCVLWAPSPVEVSYARSSINRRRRSDIIA